MYPGKMSYEEAEAMGIVEPRDIRTPEEFAADVEKRVADLRERMLDLRTTEQVEDDAELSAASAREFVTGFPARPGTLR